MSRAGFRNPIPGWGAGSPWRKSPLHSSGDASRLSPASVASGSDCRPTKPAGGLRRNRRRPPVALFVGYIYPLCALLTPCQAGASPLSVQRAVSPRAAGRRFATGSAGGGRGLPGRETAPWRVCDTQRVPRGGWPSPPGPGVIQWSRHNDRDPERSFVECRRPSRDSLPRCSPRGRSRCWSPPGVSPPRGRTSSSSRSATARSRRRKPPSTPGSRPSGPVARPTARRAGCRSFARPRPPMSARSTACR